MPACLQAAAAPGLAAKSLGRPADDKGGQSACAPAQPAAVQSLSQHRPAQPDCERSLACTAAGSCFRQREPGDGVGRLAAGPTPAGTAFPQEAQLVVCMLTSRQHSADQDGSHSPGVDPAAGSFSPLISSAALPGRQSLAGLPGAPAEAPGPLDSAAVEQQEACPQTVLVQDHQVGCQAD